MPFCDVHRARAERDYIFISGLTPAAPIPAVVSWTAVVAAMRERGQRKLDVMRRRAILERACNACGCAGTDSPDTYYSCLNCLSTTLPHGDFACAFQIGRAHV